MPGEIPDDSVPAGLSDGEYERRWADNGAEFRRVLEIEQLPQLGVTIIEGTRYSNQLLCMLGQDGPSNGPFLITDRDRESGNVTLRTISVWPEAPDETAEKRRFDKFHAMQTFLMDLVNTPAGAWRQIPFIVARAAAILRGDL